MKEVIYTERLVIIGLMILALGLVLGLYVAQATRITDEKLQQARTSEKPSFELNLQ